MVSLWFGMSRSAFPSRINALRVTVHPSYDGWVCGFGCYFWLKFVVSSWVGMSYSTFPSRINVPRVTNHPSYDSWVCGGFGKREHAVIMNRNVPFCFSESYKCTRPTLQACWSWTCQGARGRRCRHCARLCARVCACWTSAASRTSRTPTWGSCWPRPTPTHAQVRSTGVTRDTSKLLSPQRWPPACPNACQHTLCIQTLLLHIGLCCSLIVLQ